MSAATPSRPAGVTIPTLEQGRYFLKDLIRLEVDFSQTDQHRGVPAPPAEKPHSSAAQRIALPNVDGWKSIASVDLAAAIARRASRRRFTSTALTLEELSFLLWATQGVRQNLAGGTLLRTVPSAGARHAFETYLAVFQVEGLDTAVYRYLPLEHALVLEFAEPALRARVIEATLGQTFAGSGALAFFWTAIPYRMEWRYDTAAHKVIALDAGHVCQNLYLACEAIGAGCCAIAAYHQTLADRLLRVDGEEEFTVYAAPVGKVDE